MDDPPKFKKKMDDTEQFYTKITNIESNWTSIFRLISDTMNYVSLKLAGDLQGCSNVGEKCILAKTLYVGQKLSPTCSLKSAVMLVEGMLVK